MKSLPFSAVPAKKAPQGAKLRNEPTKDHSTTNQTLDAEQSKGQMLMTWHKKERLTWGSGPLLCMAGYSSLCELFFIMSKFDFDRVDPLEPNFLVLDNIDIE